MELTVRCLTCHIWEEARDGTDTNRLYMRRMIDGAPEPVFLSPDGDDGLVEVPFVAEPAGWSLADILGERLQNFSAQSLMVWRETMPPTAASISSTMRRLSGSRK